MLIYVLALSDDNYHQMLGIWKPERFCLCGLPDSSKVQLLLILPRVEYNDLILKWRSGRQSRKQGTHGHSQGIRQVLLRMQPLWAWSAAVGCQLPPSLEETTSPTKENRWLWWPRWIAWTINRCQSLRSVQMILFSVTLKLRKPRPSVDLEEPSTSQRSHHPHSTSLTILLKLNQRGSFVHWSMLQFLIHRFIKLRIVCPSSQSMMGSNQHPRHPVAFINPWGTEERHYLGAWAEIRHGCAPSSPSVYVPI